MNIWLGCVVLLRCPFYLVVHATVEVAAAAHNQIKLQHVRRADLRLSRGHVAQLSREVRRCEAVNHTGQNA